MKPSWDFAPEWANYTAKDDDGLWWWYEDQPVYYGGRWYADSGKTQSAGSDEKLSLEKRPTKE
jgi:hypothetical protein